MKPLLRYSAPFLATLALSMGTSLASDDFAEGEVAIIFYQITPGEAGSPPTVGPDTYIFNLGAGSLYRENTQNNVPVSTINPAIASSNIAADLTATFGPDWAEVGTIYWSVFGGVTALPASPVNGDPARTTYTSRARASLGATGAGSTINTISSTNRGILSTNMFSFFHDSQGVNDTIHGLFGSVTSGVNVSGAVIPTTNNKSADEFMPPLTTGTFFGVGGIEPRQIFTAGTISGSADVQGALDIYRFIHTTAGADLTAGASTGNAVAGTGQFIGALTIDTSGNLKIQAVGSAPPVANFSTWATNNNVTGGPNGDSDHDGISNLVEYALALNPAGSDGAPGTFSGSTISFTKRAEAVTNNDVTYAIEESDDLGITNAWHVVTPTTNTPSAITYTLPAGSAKKFARLVVKPAP